MENTGPALGGARPGQGVWVYKMNALVARLIATTRCARSWAAAPFAPPPLNGAPERMHSSTSNGHVLQRMTCHMRVQLCAVVHRLIFFGRQFPDLTC
jgi:hypothetical protein